jgi:ABC-type multidrug transport system ATPase subunit
MIQLRSVRIEEFRGIRELELDLGGENFVVWGPNGSGKSGVVDAIDFALTGSIARLTGAGTTGLSVAKHGPHVHQRDNPAAARVVLGFSDPASGQHGVLTRDVKSPRKFELDPDTAELRAAIEEMANHPELVLSRREIIKFIVAEAGKRAQEVQALLKLDRLDDIRKVLRTATSKSSSALSLADGELQASEAAMLRHLDLTELLSDDMASVINERRIILGLEPIAAVTIDTDLLAGIDQTNIEPPFDKAGALRDLAAIKSALENPTALVGAVEKLRSVLAELSANPGALASLKERSLVLSGLDLVDEARCPLCDLEWPSVDHLQQHLQEKLARLGDAETLRTQITSAAATMAAALRPIRELGRTANKHALALNASDLSDSLQGWTEGLAVAEGRLGTVEGCVEIIDSLSSDPLAEPDSMRAQLDVLIAQVTSIPDQTAERAAQSFLTIADERWRRVRNARSVRAKAAATHSTAKTVYDAYCEVADDALNALYRTVEADFAKYYRQVNVDDESAFTAELDPSAGKLDLNVDFYGLGKFPPAAYHSEGHQDGMGVCLYLALVNQLLGDNFRFAVLDDVVMSVDSSHRREFCKLLKTQFPLVQFVITTHDPVWARQMQTSGLVARRGQAHFHGWSVDGGPIYEQGADVWTAIASNLAQDDVSTGAARLRRFLEAATAEIAESIGARVPFRAQGGYDLGELLGAVNGRHSELLKRAAKSANSWNNDNAMKAVDTIKETRAQVLRDQTSEGWAINPLVHYNEWANMTRAEFEPVVETSKNFLALFACENCGGTTYVVGRPGDEDSLRCSCGSVNLNLKLK